MPAELAAWVARGLAKDPEQRWADAGAMRAELATLVPSTYELPTLSQQSAALNLDYMLVVALVWPIAWLLGGFWSHTALVTECVLLGLMFAWSESRLGTTLGKRVFGLAVRDGTTGSHPTFRQALARASIVGLPYYAVWLSQPDPAAWIFDWMSGGRVLGSHWVWTIVIGTCVALGAYRSKRSRWTAVEKWTNTRVIRVRRQAEHRATSAVPAPPEPIASGGPQCGPYRLEGSLPAAAGSVFVMASEPSLGRPVHVLIGPSGTDIPLPPQAVSRNRTTRLRYLTSGQDGNRTWHSFSRPTALSLREAAVLLVGRQARFVTALAEELLASLEERSLPGGLSLDHVQVQSDGTPLLLDWTPGPVDPSAQPAVAADAQALLREIACGTGRAVDPQASLALEIVDALQLPTLHETVAALRRIDMDRVAVAGRHRVFATATLSLLSGLSLAACVFIVLMTWNGIVFVVAETDLVQLRQAEDLVVTDSQWQQVAAEIERQAAAEKVFRSMTATAPESLLVPDPAKRGRKYQFASLADGRRVGYTEIDSPAWRRVRQDPALLTELRSLRSELEARQAALGSGFLGSSIQKATLVVLPAAMERRPEGPSWYRKRITLDLLARLLHKPGTLRLSIPSARQGSMLMVWKGVVWLGLGGAMLNMLVLRFCFRVRVMARSGTSRWARYVRPQLRFLVVELPGLVLLVCALSGLRLGFGPQGLQSDQLWLIPLVGIAWSLLWNAPWSRRAPADRLAGNELMVQ